jgi:hypothetical protein
MAKKAVIVGVSDYRNYAKPLVAAEFEAGEWARLFASYGFTQITILTSHTKVTATRTNVLAALTALLSHSQQNDQLVLFFIGHGQVVRAHVEGKYKFEEALIVYPELGDTQLKGAQITDSDVTEIVKTAHLADGSRFLIGIDTCFAAYFDVVIPPGAEELSIPNPEFDTDRDISKVRELGSLGGDERPLISGRPIIVAGAGRQETALQLPVNGKDRMLFSWRALDWLGTNQSTFHNLVYKDILPLKKDYPQTPALRGDTSREGETFPGGQAPARLPSAREVQGAEGDAMYWLDVRFQGLCCFADAPRESDPFKKRMLIPYDDRIDPAKRHIAFIEVAEDLVLSSTGPGPTKIDPHAGGGVGFLRWELKGHRIDFNAAAAPSLETTLSYQKHIPGLWTLCGSGRDLDYNPKAECFTPAPSATLVAAFTDLSTGILTAGPLENVATTYIRNISGQTYVIRTPKFVQWMLPIDGAAGVINLVPVDGGEPTVIMLKEGASVLIGNMRDADIFEDPDAGEEAPESFLIYYYLAENPVNDPALPATTGVPINGCSSSGWP